MMTAPIWMASPPEVHSALLSSGPGPGSLLAAAGAWSSLSATYASVAEELSAVLAAVQAGAWEGPTAEHYVAAHVPYLMWLVQASTDSAATAARHENAAAAYTAALAAMPTLLELAANHATHAVLAATNFFGINAIPIALNEAEYVGMWIQAAATMAQYELLSLSALTTSAPHTIPPPQIIKPIQSNDSSDTGGKVSDIVDNDSGDPYDLSWWVNRFLEPLDTLERDITEFPQNPSLAISQLQSDIPGLIADETGHAAEAYEAFAPEINVLALSLTAFNPGLSGLAGLSGLGEIEPDAVPSAAEPAPQTSSVPASTGSPPVSAAPVPASAPSPAPTSAPPAAPTSAPASGAPPPAAGVESAAFPYLVGGPRMGAGSGMPAGAQRKAPEPDAAALAVAASAWAAQGQRERRRRRAASDDRYRGYRHEFLDADSGARPDLAAEATSTASGQGAGPLGFAGTTRHLGYPAVEAAGLAALDGDEFGGGPSIPMVPRTWERVDLDNENDFH